MPTCHGQTRLLLHGSGFQTVPLQCPESKGPLRLSTAQCSHCSKGKCSSSSNSQMQHLEVPKSHEFCLLHLQRGRSRSHFQGVVMAAEGTWPPPKKCGKRARKKILPLFEQIPGTPTPTLFKGKIFEGAATTHRRKKHSAVHPTSCADCCQIGGKVTHHRQNNNFKIIINELSLTNGKKNPSCLYK